MHKRLTHGVGYDIRETADTVSLTIDKFIPDSDQFEVGHKEVDGTHWFTIRRGYCTVMDHGGWGPDSEVSNASGSIDVSLIGSDLVEYQGYGGTNSYDVTSCNAYGYKKVAANGNLLNENSFAPDSNEHRTIVIFLYRHTPGYGVPKLAVCSWPKMRDYFLNSSNCSATSVMNPLMGCPPVIAVRLRYDPINISGTYFNAYATAASPLDVSQWFGLGTHIQVLAFYDKTDKKLYQVHKGHVRMDATPTTIAWERNVDNPEDPFITNTGWHAYFYSGASGTTATGLTFESPPAQTAGQPPFSI